MRVVFDPNLKARLSLDEANRVKAINHFQEYWESDRKTPLLAATDYLHQMADVLNIPKAQLKNLHQKVSFLEPREQGMEYRLSEEKTQFNSTTLGFYQTYLNIPVWRAGLKVTAKHGPYRIIHSVNTSQEGVEVEMPKPEVIRKFQKLFTMAEFGRQKRRLKAAEGTEERETGDFIRKLVEGKPEETTSKATVQDEARLIRGRFYIYKYDEAIRFPKVGGRAITEEPTISEPMLPLPPVHKKIKEGQYYVVAEITFTLRTKEHGRLNWLALVELETLSVLYLRALVGFVNGLVFLYDPITSTGNAALTPGQGNAVLDPHRTSELLPHLDGPVGGVQSLRGDYVNITNMRDPNIAPPTETAGTDLTDSDKYHVRTNEFAAVNAYFHATRFFDLVESLGFTIADYFDTTVFPIEVDHRGCIDACPSGIECNAACHGDGLGGIDFVQFMLNDLTNTTDPVGRAVDWWCHLHELGAHGILYEHVDSANFGFSHGPGDALAALTIDPYSQAPDRFLYTPWRPIRRFDRDPTAGWAWGGDNDDKGYQSGEILATTLFRVYRSIGGDSANLNRQIFASRMMLWLLLQTVYDLTPDSNPDTAQAFAEALMATDSEDWTSEVVYGGAYKKVIEWSFVKQGLSALEPAVDVYIEDGRGGEYPYQAVHWENTSIWNRRNPDDGPDHEEPAPDVPNYAYVKIKNRGTQTATNVRVKGYHCTPAAGVAWPNDFQAFTTAELTAPGGGTLLGNDAEEKTVGPFEWTPVVNAWGHDCMLMIVTADDDPSNVDNFTLGEFIQDWRLVPNDNNVGQRNVVLAPGGGGSEGLMRGLHGLSFWVGNPHIRKAAMELRAQLPEFLAKNGWRLSFKGLPQNRFELRSGKQREIIIELHPGKDFDKNLVESAANRDIRISVYADEALIGGMTYRLDPAISQAYHVARKPDCSGKARELLECLNISGQKVKKVQVHKVTVDIKMRDEDCDC